MIKLPLKFTQMFILVYLKFFLEISEVFLIFFQLTRPGHWIRYKKCSGRKCFNWRQTELQKTAWPGILFANSHVNTAYLVTRRILRLAWLLCKTPLNDNTLTEVIRTRRMSAARHGVPQRGSKKRKDLTRTGTTLLSTDIDRSTEHQYMDMLTDRTCPDLATRKPDENLLQLVEKTTNLTPAQKEQVMPKASTMAEDGTESNKAARDPPSNGTSALWRKRIVRSHQRLENHKMAENMRKSLKDG